MNLATRTVKEYPSTPSSTRTLVNFFIFQRSYFLGLILLFLKIVAILVGSILAGFLIASYIDTHQLLDDQKSSSLTTIRARLTAPIREGKGNIVVRKIKDNWVYDVKKKEVLFLEDISSRPNSTYLEFMLRSPIKKDQYRYILTKLNELKLPPELALIPVIESEYNSAALSTKGAGGLWQLMPKTAGELGLTNSDRFQLEASTSAALIYFKQLYERFGNWELAIAAYNAGGTRVERALSKNPLAKNINELNLPKETKNYVNKFYEMQAANISKDFYN